MVDVQGLGQAKRGRDVEGWYQQHICAKENGGGVAHKIAAHHALDPHIRLMTADVAESSSSPGCARKTSSFGEREV